MQGVHIYPLVHDLIFKPNNVWKRSLDDNLWKKRINEAHLNRFWYTFVLFHMWIRIIFQYISYSQLPFSYSTVITIYKSKTGQAKQKMPFNDSAGKIYGSMAQKPDYDFQTKSQRISRFEKYKSLQFFLILHIDSAIFC